MKYSFTIAASLTLGSFLILQLHKRLPADDSPTTNPRLETTTQTVALGAQELTAGIPGSGPVTVEQLESWLGRPENHVPLKLVLPVGLDLLPNRLEKLPSPMPRAKIELGRQLFFDTRLSGDNTVSCATCHDPDHGYTVATRFGKGVRGQEGKRNPPSLINRVMFAGIGEEEFWYGHAASLEDAVLVAITDPIEMDSSLDGVLKTLRRTKGYDLQFRRIYQ